MTIPLDTHNMCVACSSFLSLNSPDIFTNDILHLINKIYKYYTCTPICNNKTIVNNMLSDKLSDRLMNCMMEQNLINFKKIYKFAQINHVTIKYKDGLNIWFTDFVDKNLVEMIHPELATIKLNDYNILYLFYGRKSLIHTKLRQIFRNIKKPFCTGGIIFKYTSPLWEHVNIYSLLNILSLDNINELITNISTDLYAAFVMALKIDVDPELVKTLFIIIKKRNIDTRKMCNIIDDLWLSNMSNCHLREITQMYDMIACNHTALACKTLFI